MALARSALPAGGQPGRAIAARRLRLARRRLTSHGGGDARRSIAQLLIVLPIVGLFLLALTIVFAVSLGATGSAEETSALLGLLLAAGMAAAFAGSLSTALQSLYLGPEIRYLLSLPIPLRTIFLAKLPEVALGTLPGAIFLLSILTGEFLGRAAPPGYVGFALAVLLCLLLTAVSLACIVTAIVVRVTPARFARLGVLAVAAGSVIAMGLSWQRLAAEMRADPTDGVATALLRREFTLRLTPGGWAGEVASAASRGEYAAAVAWLGPLVGATLLLLGVASWVFARTFSRNLDVMTESHATVRRRRAPRWARPLLRLVPRPLVPWVKREWLLMVRDVRRLSAAIWTVTALLTYVAVTLVRDPYDDRPADERFWLSYGALALLPWTISMGTAMFATGSEGRGIEALGAVPVRPTLVALGKLYAYLIPTAGFSVAVCLLFAAVDGELSPRPAALCGVVLWVSVGVTLIDFASSAIAPNFEAEHVQRSTGLTGRLLGSLAALLFLALTGLAGLALPGTGPLLARLLGLPSQESEPALGLALLLLAASVPGLLTLVAVGRYRRLLGPG